MGTTLTIRNLDAGVKRRLRIQAAVHGRAMEAEVRDILTRAMMKAGASPAPASRSRRGHSKSACTAVRGLWKGRLTTDEIMEMTRGD